MSVLDDYFYSWDEVCLIFGMIFDGMAVAISGGCGMVQLAQPGNRGWATVVEGVNVLY